MSGGVGSSKTKGSAEFARAAALCNQARRGARATPSMPRHSPTSGWDRSFAQVLRLPEAGVNKNDSFCDRAAGLFWPNPAVPQCLTQLCRRCAAAVPPLCRISLYPQLCRLAVLAVPHLAVHPPLL